MEKTAIRQKMAEMLAQQASSGMTKKDFCKARGINPATFYYWQRKLQEAEGEPTNGFERVHLVEEHELEVQLANGQWLGLRSRSLETLAGLLGAMGATHA